MQHDETFYVNNYAFYGESAKRRYNLTQKEVNNIKDKNKEKGIYMLPIRKLAKDNLPQENKKDSFGAVSFVVSCLDFEDQEQIVELAKNIPSPEVLIDQSIALQQYRIKIGLENENEQGRLLDTTESAMANYVNMIQAKKNMNDGQDINLNVHNSISSLIEEIEENGEQVIDMDKL